MGLWTGDYVQLQNEIEYFNLVLKWERSEEERVRVIEEIDKRKQQAKEFLSIANALDGIERTIFLKKYIESKKQREIAEELGTSTNYINKKATELKHKIEFAEKLIEQRDKVAE